MQTSPTDAAISALGGGKGVAAKKLTTKGIHVRKGHKGGYIAKHEMEDADGNESGKRPEYPIPSMKELMAHLQEHMGEEAEEISEEKGQK